MILNFTVIPCRNWNMIINLVGGFVRNSYSDLPKCRPDIGSGRLVTATKFPIIAQCNLQYKFWRGFLLPVGLFSRLFTNILSAEELLQICMEMVQIYEWWISNILVLASPGPFKMLFCLVPGSQGNSNHMEDENVRR